MGAVGGFTICEGAKGHGRLESLQGGLSCSAYACLSPMLSCLQIFPTWEKAGFSSKEHTPILSSAEVEGLKELCKLKVRVVLWSSCSRLQAVLSSREKGPC